MIAIETLRELYEFNYWARDRQLKACEALSSEQLLRPMGSSFSSVRDSLAHLLVVEWLWLERWLGRIVTKQDTLEFAGENFPSVRSISARWESIEQAMRDYLRGLSDSDLTKPFTYTNLQGVQATYPLWRLLFHLVNHQTYHRGQVTALLRQLGAQAVSTDYLYAHEVHISI
jgi:uncharacterized damage-inducible protein DinB